MGLMFTKRTITRLWITALMLLKHMIKKHFTRRLSSKASRRLRRSMTTLIADQLRTLACGTSSRRLLRTKTQDADEKESGIEDNEDSEEKTKTVTEAADE